MTTPERKAYEHRRSGIIDVAGENHPPVAIGLREVGLDAAGQADTVAGLGLAGDQLRRRDSIALDSHPFRDADFTARSGGVLEVLGQQLLVEAHREPGTFDRLPLAVSREVPEVPIELLDAHRPRAKALADRCCRRTCTGILGHEPQLTPGALLSDDVVALNVAGQGHVRRLGHGPMVAPALSLTERVTDPRTLVSSVWHTTCSGGGHSHAAVCGERNEPACSLRPHDGQAVRLGGLGLVSVVRDKAVQRELERGGQVDRVERALVR